LAYWFYIDGVDTIIRMAVGYGISIGLSGRYLILALLITQFIGFPSAIFFGYLSLKIGAKRAIFLAIFTYLLVSIWGAFIKSRAEFFLLASVVGLVQGGVQALSRSFYAKLIPKEESGYFFGVYNLIGKFAVVIGPVLMGMACLGAKYLGFSSEISCRISIFSVSLLFILGGTLFYFVKEENPS
jgi:UMF1 family MFS transporter